MKLWLVWTEEGEYEQYSRDLRGVFNESSLAKVHAEQLKGEVEEWEVLFDLPRAVTHYEWGDVVNPNGQVSPDAHWPNGEPMRASGRRRSQWASWSNEEVSVKSQVKIQDGSHWILVEGFDQEAVKAEHHRLVREALASVNSDANG